MFTDLSRTTFHQLYIIMSNETFHTPLTDLFGIKHPVILAGMNVAAGPELAAAVTNAGGLGVIGGVGTSRALTLFVNAAQ